VIPSYRVLGVEDNPGDARLIQVILAEDETISWRLEVVGSLAAAEVRLQDSEWDLVLLDLSLPDSMGLPTLERVRELRPELPVLVVTGQDSVELGSQITKAGAADYIPKSLLETAYISRAMHNAIERTRMIGQLRREEARSAAILGVAPSAIISVDANHRIAVFNQGAERTFGYKASEVVGEGLECLLPEGVRASHHRMADAFMKASGEKGQVMGVPGEIAGRRKDGTVFPAHAVLRRVVIDGEVLVTVGILDLTELKRAERELREREGELRQAQKMEAVGQLASGIAHDFNNVLAIITSGAEIIRRRTREREDLHGALQTIVRAVDRGRSITGRMLEFTRKGEVDFRVLPAVEVLRDVVEIGAHALPKRISVSMAAPTTEGFVRGNKEQLTQVLLNLCINAADAIEGEGCITLTAREPSAEERERHPLPPDGEGEGHLVISVSDTGVGMDDAIRARIFDPFFTTKEQGKGTGLGLSIVYSIVDQHGGWIDVESEVGVGTTFKIGLRRAAGPAAGDIIESTWSDERSLAIEGDGGPSIHVLFVDDEEMLRELADEALGDLGFRVTLAAAPEFALELLRASPRAFDVLVTDLEMAGEGGIGLVSAVREKAYDLPIIVSSGYVSEDVQDRLVSLGVNAILRKPFSFPELVTQIRAQVRSWPGSGAAPDPH